MTKPILKTCASLTPEDRMPAEAKARVMRAIQAARRGRPAGQKRADGEGLPR